MEWFRHDINAHDDIKLKKLIKKYGFAAVGMYWFLIELIYCAGGRLERSEAIDEVSLVDGLTEEDAEVSIEELISVGLIFADGTKLGSHRTDSEILFDSTRRKRFSDMGKASAEARLKVNTGSTDVERTLNTLPNHTLPNHTLPLDKIEGLNNNNIYLPPTPSFVESETPDIDKTTAAYNGIKAHDVVSDWMNRFNNIYGLPKVKKITINDETNIQTILRHFSEADINETFNKLAKSDFLQGKNNKNWKVSFDWFTDLGNFTKIFNGKYDNPQEVKKEKTFEEIHGMSRDEYEAIRKRNEELLARIDEEERRNGNN